MKNNKVVYLHRRKNTDIFYIGSGVIKRAYDIKGRTKAWRKKALLRRSQPLQFSSTWVNKYFICDYSIQIIATNLSKENSLELEQFIIKEASEKYSLANKHHILI